jgi:hypothetical protein
MSGHNMSLLAIVEEGGSGAWYKIVAAHRAPQGSKLGIMSQRFIGTGAYMEAPLFGGRAKVWMLMPVIKPTGALIGVRVPF